METSAAIYVRRSALDDREGDNRSTTSHPSRGHDRLKAR